jgi:large subunit ribosomal protein L25
MTSVLTAETRAQTGKGVARSLRRQGRIPAVIYGHARQPQPLSISAREFERLLERIAGENTVVELVLDGKPARTLIREIQRDPIKRNVLHVDFQELVAGERVTVHIPIVLEGTAPGVKAGGILNQVMQELTCRVDPLQMPSHIAVDVSGLTIGHSIHVGEVVVPEGVEVLDDPGATVAVVSAPKAAEAVAPAPGEVEAAAEPELIRRPKAEEEEEGEGE